MVTSTPGRLLLVDDDADIRAVLQDFLEEEGYSVSTACNGREALTLLRQDGVPCVILLDLMMPIMDGWQFLEFKNSDDQLSPIPVVVISAYRDSTPHEGVAATLAKPLDVDRLLAVVQQHCGGRAS